MNPILDENIEDPAKARRERVLGTLRLMEYALTGLLLIGLFFRIQHWPFGLLIVFGALVLFFIIQVVKVFFVKDRLTATVKVLAVAVMLAGYMLGYLQVRASSAIVVSGLLLYLSFNFITIKKNF